MVEVAGTQGDGVLVADLRQFAGLVLRGWGQAGACPGEGARRTGKILKVQDHHIGSLYGS
ncbi:hypothetical protein GCM10027187_18740 [Streptosporangium sandarakinum]